MYIVDEDEMDSIAVTRVYVTIVCHESTITLQFMHMLSIHLPPSQHLVVFD